MLEKAYKKTMQKCHWFAREVLWRRHRSVPVTGTLPRASRPIQTTSSAVASWSLQRETTLACKYSLSSPFSVRAGCPQSRGRSPPQRILLRSHGAMMQVFCSLRRHKDSLERERQKVDLQLLWKALINHQASTYEFWYPLFPEPWFPYRPLEILSLLWIKRLWLERLKWEAHSCPQQKKNTRGNRPVSVCALCWRSTTTMCDRTTYLALCQKGSYDHPWK